MTCSSKEFPLDLSRKLNEWAIATGRYLQSAQTQYVHCFEKEMLQGAQTIPIVENVLFILALFRSRLLEQIQEGKILLKKLLAFQNLQDGESHGNFPIYLHQYPMCEDPNLVLQLIVPFYWILKQFGHILGHDLRKELEKAARLALENGCRMHQAKPFPYSFAVRLAAAKYSFGCLWENSLLQLEGKSEFELLEKYQLEGWQTTFHLGELLVALQMVYPSLKNSPWKPLWNHIEQTWHFTTGCYAGPCIREWQEGEEPQPNLYDLYGGFFSGQFSQRSTLLRAYHLQGVLIQPSHDQFDFSSFILINGEQKKQNWQTVHQSDWALTLLEKKEPIHPSKEKTFVPFRYIWGDLQRMHSFICEGGSYDKVEYQINDNSFQLIYHFIKHQDESPEREVEFFVDYHPEFSFTFNNQATTTFELDQLIVFNLGKQRLSIIFELLQGEGEFLGHLMRGNRPSQLNCKDKNRFQAYDWTFFLRTIRRQPTCQIKVLLSLLS